MIRDALRGAHVVLTGSTGFVGKVWLSHLLYEVPEIGRVTLIVRDGEMGARERIERELDTSPAFRPLRERHGASWAAYASGRIEVLAGDCALPMCGIDPDAVGTADVVVHVAGLTDFQPDPRDALATNVRGAMHAADLAAALSGRLVHVSTCYVAGARQGEIAEDLPACSPDGTPFDLLDEIAFLEAACAHDEKRDRIEAASKRAEALGWPNLYTFTKALAEHHLAARADVAATIVRPAIVECAVGYPFVGWNEGLNTAGPLAWLLSSPFRSLPSNPDHRFDVVPVDLVAKGLTLAVAAALRDEPPAIWQVASSHRNPFTFRRAIELNGLAFRKHTRHRASALDAVLRHLDPIAAPASDGPGSIPWFARLAKAAHERLPDPDALVPDRLPFLRAPVRAAHDAAWFALGEAKRTLGRVDRMLALYRPFVHDHDWTFRADRAAAATAALSPEERLAFGFDVESIDWRAYWVDVEYPGLRTWTFPLLDGQEAPRDAPSDPPLRLTTPLALREGVA